MPEDCCRMELEVAYKNVFSLTNLYMYIYIYSAPNAPILLITNHNGFVATCWLWTASGGVYDYNITIRT